mgnify:CR=1 FL=1
MSTDFAPLSVLIVDDEAPARDRLRDLLGDIADTQPTRIAGMAASGVEALAVLEREPVDLVLTDIRMPAMDGIELARHLGRLSRSPAVIFATTAPSLARVGPTGRLMRTARGEPLEALPENVRDKRLLLIDDIVTTGSTLTECVRVLREAGAADVVCLTLARTEEEH